MFDSKLAKRFLEKINTIPLQELYSRACKAPSCGMSKVIEDMNKIAFITELKDHFEIVEETNRSTTIKITDKVSVKELRIPNHKFFIVISGLSVEVEGKDLLEKLGSLVTSELLRYQSEVKAKTDTLDRAMYALNGITIK